MIKIKKPSTAPDYLIERVIAANFTLIKIEMSDLKLPNNPENIHSTLKALTQRIESILDGCTETLFLCEELEKRK